MEFIFGYTKNTPTVAFPQIQPIVACKINATLFNHRISSYLHFYWLFFDNKYLNIFKFRKHAPFLLTKNKTELF